MALPLHKAIKDGNEELAASLVENGASVNDKDARGDTALHLAASKGRVGTTRLLLQSGADKDSRDARLQTPLYLAAARCHAAVVRVLMENGADSTLRSRAGSSPLQAAFKNSWVYRSTEVLETMIEFGVDVNDRDNGGRTPLHDAAAHERAQFPVIELLVGAGANVEARDAKGRTPLNAYAANIHAVRSLLSRGAGVNTRDNEGSTPLHRIQKEPNDWDESPLINMGCAKAVDLLLIAGADETVLDGNGRTPSDKLLDRHWSFQTGHLWLAEIHIARARKLLASAPPDRVARRWRRRCLLVMCIARHRRGEAQLVDEPAGAAGDNWTRAAAWVLDAGLELDGIFRTIVGYL